jgi:hypothetical protein
MVCLVHISMPITGSQFSINFLTFFFFLLIPIMIDKNGAETVKLISEDLVTYKVFGEPGGAHYGHYDLVGGRLV